MRKIYIAMTILIVLVSIAIVGTGSAKDKGPAVIRLVSNPNPKSGEIVTVTILPLGLSSYYAVEEHIGSLDYTGEHTADSNPSGTIFLNLTAKSFSYKVKMPMFTMIGETSITGEYWTQPGLKQNIGKTVLERAPTVYVVPAFQEVSPGDVFSVDIRVNPAGKGVSAGSIIVKFDAGAMQAESVEPGELLGTDPLPIIDIDNVLGNVKIDVARTGATSPPTTEGTFASITLKAGDEVSSRGYHLFTLKKAQLVDENSLDIPGVASADGAVAIGMASEISPEPEKESEETVVTPTPIICEKQRWDINEDGQVDDIDLDLLSSHYRQTAPSPYPRWDINENGSVEIKDLSLLGRHYYEDPCYPTEQPEWYKWQMPERIPFVPKVPMLPVKTQEPAA